MSQKTDQTKTAPPAGSPASDVDLAAQLDALFASVNNTTSKVSAIATHAADVARSHAAADLSAMVESAVQAPQESTTLDNDAIASQLDELFAHAASLPDEPPPPEPEVRGPPVELSNNDIAAELAAHYATQSPAPEAPPATEPTREDAVAPIAPDSDAPDATTPEAPAEETDLASQLDALLASVKPAAAPALPDAVSQSLENQTHDDDLASQLDSLLSEVAAEHSAAAVESPVAAGEDAPAGLDEADLASQLDSLLSGLEPATEANEPEPVPEPPTTAAQTSSNDELASQLDALLESAEAAASPKQPAEATQEDETADSDAAKPPVLIDKIDKSLAAKSEEAIKDEIAGRGPPRNEMAPSTPIEEIPEAEGFLAAIPPTTPAAAASPEGTDATSGTPAAVAVAAPAVAPTTGTPTETTNAAPVAPARPGLLKRAAIRLKPVLEGLLARVNVVEAATLKLAAPITAPIARATGLERKLLNAFAIYSLVVGLCGAYYAVFVRPSTFIPPRPPAFDLREDTLPHSVEHAAGATSHTPAAGHESASSGGGEHEGEAKAPSKAKAKAKAKPPAKQKAPAKKAAESGGEHH